MEYLISGAFTGGILILCFIIYLKNQELKKIQLCLKNLIKALDEKEKEYHKFSYQTIQAREEARQADKEKQDLEKEVEVLQERRKAAEELADKELQLEQEKRRAEFENTLKKEFDELRATSDTEQYKKELADVQAAILKHRADIEVFQRESLQKIEKEDYESHHSIALTPQEQNDVVLLRSFSEQLNKSETIFKLIWTEYYQKPIQALCKNLVPTKVSGIYCITHKESGRKYVGQAVDISSRWKDHAKAGLGIGGLYRSNRFYRAIFTEGLENFTFEVLEQVTGIKALNEREAHWIDIYNCTTFGYNSRK